MKPMAWALVAVLGATLASGQSAPNVEPQLPRSDGLSRLTLLAPQRPQPSKEYLQALSIFDDKHQKLRQRLNWYDRFDPHNPVRAQIREELTQIWEEFIKLNQARLEWERSQKTE